MASDDDNDLAPETFLGEARSQSPNTPINDNTHNVLLELLTADDQQTRLNAAWSIGLIVAEYPQITLDLFPRILPLLKSSPYPQDAARVLAYIAENYPIQTRRTLKETYSRKHRASIAPFLNQLASDDPSITPTQVFVLQTLPENPGGVADADRLTARTPPRNNHETTLRSASRPTKNDGSNQSSNTDKKMQRIRGLVQEVADWSPYETIDILDVMGASKFTLTCKVRVPAKPNRSVAVLKILSLTDELTGEHSPFETVMDRWVAVSDSDNVVSVIEWRQNPRAWLLTEYMNDGNLTDQAAAKSLRQKLGYLVQLLDTVNLLHNQGVYHGGLFPQNILFSRDYLADTHVPKTSEVGLYPVLMEQTNRVKQTHLRFAAPEHLEPHEFGWPDALTDIYQFGGLAYWILTGVPAFTGPLLEVRQQIVTEAPSPASSINPSLPAQSDIFFETALARNKRDRFSSIAELRKALVAVINSIQSRIES